MIPTEIDETSLPNRLRISEPSSNHPLYGVSDTGTKKYEEGSGLLILEWDYKPEADFEAQGTRKAFEFELLGSCWQVYVLDEGVRFHLEDLYELSRDKQQTATIRNYFLPEKEKRVFDYKLPEEAKTVAGLQRDLKKSNTERSGNCKDVALVIELPRDEGASAFFFVSSIEQLQEGEATGFARQPVMLLRTFETPGWMAFGYPCARPKEFNVAERKTELLPQVIAPGMTPHAPQQKTKSVDWKKRDKRL